MTLIFSISCKREEFFAPRNATENVQVKEESSTRSWNGI